MDEVRRFIRYSIPGIVCIMQLALVLVICEPGHTVRYFLDRADKFNSLGVVITAFLGSGGLGFLISQIYWCIVHIWKRWYTDHRRALRELSTRFQTNDGTWIQYLDIRRLQEGSAPKSLSPEEIADLDQVRSWIIMAHVWDSRKKRNKKIEALTPLVERLVDMTHCLGAVLVGTVLSAVPAVLLFDWQPILVPGSIWMAALIEVVWCILVFVYGSAYWNTLRKLESVTRSSATEAIVAEYNELGQPIQVYYATPRNSLWKDQ